MGLLAAPSGSIRSGVHIACAHYNVKQNLAFHKLFRKKYINAKRFQSLRASLGGMGLYDLLEYIYAGGKYYIRI